MESEKLMPCPFCGSNDISMLHPADEYTGEEIKNLHFILCGGCLMETGAYYRVATLRRLWNRRVSADDHK